MKIAYLSLGSNVGDREKYIKKSIQKIQELEDVQILEVSPFLETKALEETDQPDFINAIIKIETILKPVILLNHLKNIEEMLGRNFRYKKGPREIDIDILIYENVQIKEENITIPHIAIKTRPFILEIFQSMKDKIYKNYI